MCVGLVFQKSFNLSFVINLRQVKTQRAKKAASTKRNEQRKPVPIRCAICDICAICGTNEVYDEISAQKLCAGMMSMSVSRHPGREGFTLQHHYFTMRKDNGAT